MNRRWLVYQAISIVLASVLIALTYDPTKGWPEVPFGVALCIALTPLFLRPTFKAEIAGSPRDQLRAKTLILVAGMVFVQTVNVAFGAFGVLPWSLALLIIGGCALVEIAAFAVWISARRRMT